MDESIESLRKKLAVVSEQLESFSCVTPPREFAESLKVELEDILAKLEKSTGSMQR